MSLAPLTAQEIRSTGGGGNWSSTATWTRVSGPGGGTPTTADHVIVTFGNPVVLDTNTGIGDLARLEIHDALTVASTAALTLGVARIDVGGPASHIAGNPLQAGQFLAGSTGTPYTQPLTIRLTDNYLSSAYNPAPASNENMSFIVHGGSTIRLHGQDSVGATPRASWLQLKNGGDLTTTSTVMSLEASPGWQVGDRLVITSTDFDLNEAEVVRVTWVSGNSVRFTPVASTQLLHPHHGTIELGLVDERAEVGLLSHNITITSEVVRSGSTMPLWDDIRAGHVMFHNRNGMDPAPTVEIDYVEFYNLGWKGALGRYPVHFHLLGNAPGRWVRNCSVHDCFNRAITLHGTNDVLVSGNVAYGTFGHSIYFEDKSEVRNVVDHNLALGTRVPTNGSNATVGFTWPTTGADYFHFHDLFVSSYWITNTQNTITNNVAAGCERHGFWYDVSTNPLFGVPGAPGAGLFAQEPVTFVGNVAHSNGEHGFWNDFVRMVPHDPTLLQPLSAEYHFVDYTAYKNRHSGIWHRGYGVHRWINARVADNRLGVYLSSEGFQSDGMAFPGGTPPLVTSAFDHTILGAPSFSIQTLEGSVVVGETNNEPASLPVPGIRHLERKGIVIYDGLIGIIGTSFHNFVTQPLMPPSASPAGPMTHRVAMAITSYTSHSQSLTGHPWSVDPRNLVLGCSFFNCTDPVLFPIPHPPSVPASPTHNAPLGVNTVSPNGIIATTIFDLDGSVPGSSPGTYLTNNTPLMRPAGGPLPTFPPLYGYYTQPLMVSGPGTTTDDAIAAVLLEIPGPQSSQIERVTFTSTTRNETLDVFDALGSVSTAAGAVKRFPTNVLLTRPGAAAPETYALSYPAGATPPTTLDLRIQFCTANRSAIFQIPYPNAPTSVDATHVLFPGTVVPLPAAPSLAQFQAGQGMWVHAGGTLHLRGFLFDLSAVGLGVAPVHPMFSGRELNIVVR